MEKPSFHTAAEAQSDRHKMIKLIQNRSQQRCF